MSAILIELDLRNEPEMLVPGLRRDELRLETQQVVLVIALRPDQRAQVTRALLEK